MTLEDMGGHACMTMMFLDTVKCVGKKASNFGSFHMNAPSLCVDIGISCVRQGLFPKHPTSVKAKDISHRKPCKL